MRLMDTAENLADPVGEFVGSQQSVGLNYFPLAVYPLRLHSIEPRTLLGQEATRDPHPLATLLDSAVVLAEPASGLSGDVPGSVVRMVSRRPTSR